MDEKLKRLEAMRAAREAKQQLAKKFAQSVTSPVSSGALGSARDGPSSPVYGGSSTQEMASPTVPEMATVAGTRPLAASLDGSRLAPSAMPEEGTPKFAVDGYALLRALPLRQSMGSADEDPRSALKGAISGTLGEECGVCTTQLVFGDNTCSSTAVSIGLLPYGGGVSSALASTAPTAVAIVSAYSARRYVESIEKERAAPYFPWGYPVGSRSPTHHALDLASAPGCVMAWVIVPLPSSYVDEQTGKETPADPRAPTSMVVHIPLVCEEEVTAVRLHPFRPGWVLGGTVHGQVVGWNLCHEWDSLSPRQLLANAKASTGNEQTLRLSPQCPSSCSFPSHEAHQGAVLSLEVLGTSSVHTLHSVSEDGWVCEWSSTQPMVLSHSTKARKVKVKEDAWGQQVMGTVACFVQHPGSSTLSHFFLGTARGYLLEGRNDAAHSISLDPMGTVVPAKGQSHGVDEAKVELVEMRQDGSITSIAVQSHSVAYRDCELVVTAATDGSCFLWFPESARHLEGFSSSVSCLAWSPTHSSVFAAGDVAGVVTLWNVHESVVAPKWSISLLPPGMHTGDSTTVVFRSAQRLDEGGKASLVTEEKEKKKKDLVTAITSLTFSENGKVLIAGSASGCLHILELSSTELFDG